MEKIRVYKDNVLCANQGKKIFIHKGDIVQIFTSLHPEGMVRYVGRFNDHYLFVKSQHDGNMDAIGWEFIIRIDILEKSLSVDINPMASCIEGLTTPYTLWRLKYNNEKRGYFISLEASPSDWGYCKNWISAITGCSCRPVKLNKVDRSLPLLGYIDHRHAPRHVIRLFPFILPFNNAMKIVLSKEEGLDLI